MISPAYSRPVRVPDRLLGMTWAVVVLAVAAMVCATFVACVYLSN